MKLKAKQWCPIHRRRSGCCGRAEQKASPYRSKWETVRPGVRRIRDEYARHPDGYRYKLSKAEMEKVLVKKVAEQHGDCSICKQPLEDMNDVVPDHIDPRGMGGAWRDDRPENIGGAHSLCNQRKGSIRNYVHSNGRAGTDKVSDAGIGEDHALADEPAEAV